MQCPYCRKTSIKVIDKRDVNNVNVIRRRRECMTCHKRFTTYERLGSIELNVIKSNGSLEKFNRKNIKDGIIKAVKKRPIANNQIDELIDDIESKLLNRKAREVRTKEIGKMILTRLRKIDHLGYILFSAVYNEFDNIDDLENEIRNLKEVHS